MNRFSILVPGLLACAAFVGCSSLHDSDEPAIAVDAAAQQDMPLPPGWTEADMQACMVAGTPGAKHAFLADGAGKWEGKSTMWMAPGMDPMNTTCTANVSMMMDGRYAKYEYASEMPGMGPFNGFALYGFDNVSQKFVCTWVDSMSTGLMNGVGELSPDGKTLTWKFTYNCPINKTPATMREVETITGKDTRTLDMYGKDPKSGVEYKMIHIELARRSS